MTPTNNPVGERREAPTDLPEGMIDWHARCSIRDLVRVYGFEEARQLVETYLNDEASGVRRHA